MDDKIQKEAIANSFSKAAESYDESAFFQKISGERLLERLDYFKLQPKDILDLGSGTGYFTRQLSLRYPDARLTGVDIANGMVKYSQQKSSKEIYICADACRLPFGDDSFDFIFSNLTIQWMDSLDDLFKELQRVIKPGGLLLFTSLGPDTLKELKMSWKHIDDYQHVNNFLDMHIVGDSLYNNNWLDPVVDNEEVILGYKEVVELMRDLKNIGAHNLNNRRSKNLTGADKLKKLQSVYQEYKLENGLLPATYELIYGHAFGAEVSVENDYHQYAVELK